MKNLFAMSGALLACSAIAVVAAGCTSQKTGFSGRATKLVASRSADAENAKPASQFEFEVGEVFSSLAKRDIWFVSSTGNVERYTAANSNPAGGFVGETWSKTGQWQLADGSSSGHRTYVSEIGLIIGKTGTACMYRIGDDTPNGSNVMPVWCGSGQSGDTRFCVTSFKVGGQAYVGGGYNKSGGGLAFVRIPIDKSKPNGLDLAAAREQGAGTGNWGYSCFTDQSRNVFWSAFGGLIHGIDLNSGVSLLGAANAPNAPFRAPALDEFSIATDARRSYAISGDPFGNLLNGGNMYTYAYEPLSKTVFGSTRDGKFTVTKAECFASKADCAVGKDHWVWSMNDLGASAGPLSSLNDGRVVGISGGQIFLFALRDYQNPAAGVTAKKIADAGGNGYMYTDFTGGTLYAADVEKSTDLSAQKDWVPGKAVVMLKMRWNAESGQPEEWRGLKLEARCYAKSGAKPAYVAVSPVPAAGTEFDLIGGACKSGLFDMVDVRISPDGTVGGFSKTRSVAFKVGQAK